MRKILMKISSEIARDAKEKLSYFALGVDTEMKEATKSH